MKRVLLTGATGFIGRQAIPCLQQRGYEIHAVSNKPVTSESDKNLRWHRADLLDARRTEKLIASVRPTHLLHFAWYVEHRKFWNAIENFRWVEASLKLLRHFQSNGGRRVVIAGTCAEYDWNREEDLSETKTPLAPQMTYGICKNSLRILAEELARLTSMSFAWGRIFFLYGEGEPPNRLVPSVIQSLLQNEVIACSPNKVRDFLYVKDVADAFVALLDSEATGAVNIASGEPRTIREVVETIAKVLGKIEEFRLRANPVTEHDPQTIVANVIRLREEVGWRPKHTFRQGIQETVKGSRRNPRATKD